MQMTYVLNMIVCGSISTQQSLILEEFQDIVHNITKFILDVLTKLIKIFSFP